MTTSDSNAPPVPPVPEETPGVDPPTEETGAIPIFRMTKIVVEDEQTRVANSPMQASGEEIGAIAEVPAAARGSESKSVDRYAFATQAIVTTPGGKECVCRTVNVTTTGLLADGPAGKETPLRLGMVCHVTLRRKTRVIDFDAEIMRIDPPTAGHRRPCFAFRINFLTREAQAELVRLIEEAKTPGGADRGGNAARLVLSFLANVAAVVLLVAMVAAAGWYFTRRDRALSVATTSLVRSSIAEVITSRSGEIVAEHRIIVRSSLDVPTVMKLSVRRGDRVTAGTVVAEPTGDTFRGALNAARNKLVLAQNRSARAAQQAQADADSAVPPDTTPQQRAEKLQRGQDAAQRGREAVAAAQTERDARASDVLKSQIMAPFDGVVVDVKIQPGDLVAPAAPICDLLDDTALRVNAQFDEADVGRIKRGTAVQVAVTGNKNVIRGAVDRIGEVVVADAKVHTVLVEIALLDRPPLRPGTTVKADVVLETRPNVLTLPRTAIIGEDAKRSVFVVGKDGELERRDVQVGIVGNDLVEIVGGLPESSVVVVDGSASGLASGLLVRSSR